MVQHKRRKLLRLPAAAIVTLLVLPRPGADPLLEAAVAWVDRLRRRGQTHLFYPVSRLQREFRTGYHRSCVLVDALAQRGEWTVGFSGDGTRYARIHSKGEA